MQAKHIRINVTFNSSNYAIDSIDEDSMEIILGIRHGDLISNNFYYLGRDKSNFYSMRILKCENLIKEKPADHVIPIKLISQYFFRQKVICGVIGCRAGSDKFTEQVQQDSFDTGKLIASYGFVTLTGGLSGVMEKAAEGARSEMGETIGILPGSVKEEANRFIQYVLPSGIGIARNYLIAQAADILIAMKGGRGTLEEMAYGLDFNKKVLSLDSWVIPEVIEIFKTDHIKEHLNALFESTFVKNLNEKYKQEL